MLKNIDPLLNADVLHALRAMGHGDALILCDTNFPADSVARHTVLGKLLRIDGVDAPRAAKAILSVFPLDSFVEQAALRMEVVVRPDEIPPVQAEVQREIDRVLGQPSPMGSIERFASTTGPGGPIA
jgi:L-fucose mutarotase